MDSSIALVGGEFTSTNKGETSLDGIDTYLKQITQSYSLIAWLREAIKAKENLSKEITKTTLEQWCIDNNKELPNMPKYENPITKDDILATWTVKDRNHYLTLSTKVSVYGKFIHPDGAYSKARKELKNKINNPVSYKESGRDTIIKKYSPSISPEKVDKEFFELQSEWRKTQAELNSYEHKIQLAIDEDTNKKNSKYAKEQTDYSNAIATLQAELRAWKDTAQQEIANLKIIVPDALRDIYNTVTNL